MEAPDARIERVQFQGDDESYALDDLIVHGASDKGNSQLQIQIQSKRTISFSPKDSVFQSVCGRIAQGKGSRQISVVMAQRCLRLQIGLLLIWFHTQPFTVSPVER